ncbi:MAG: cell division protein FtsZ [Candidatus Aenigmarchaeota archaeon]|nr:cell division protein FtsZ [Candidatus Aenigmarchaeota archaeon]MCX8190768.1 cell division protein FtsZ [Candidatus Aenigmarchaeota archaeon]MDW8160015.1 cell division protein FtsZ [Candidatus Aenigmarchaeota archaeon]
MAIRNSVGTSKCKEDEEIKKFAEKAKVKIKVVGCGGAGSNAISRITEMNFPNVETIAINTDALDLLYSSANRKILIGKETTKGFGAGADIIVGRKAAEEQKEEIRNVIKGADLLFLTAGLGGGTGSSSIPLVASLAKEMNILSVAIVTLPFFMEGRHRAENARIALEELEKYVDTLIVIQNERLLEIVPNLTLAEAFNFADEILSNAVKGIIDVVNRPGLINVDFADLKTILKEGKFGVIGIGESETEKRSVEAATRAISHPLLKIDIKNGKAALIDIVSDQSLTVKESQKVIETIASHLNEDAKIIWGVQIDKEMDGKLKVISVITGLEKPEYFKIKTLKKKKEIENYLGVEVVE